MPIRVMQPTFAGGELAPGLYGRVDLAKYTTGLKRCRNCFVRTHGGVSNRPGTAHVGEAADSARTTRLVGFQFSTEDSYALEFGHLTLRVIRNGGHVVETAVAITGITQANPAVVTATAHGYSAGDHVFITGVAGMTAVNDRVFQVANPTADTFALRTLDDTDFDGSGLAAPGTGGSASRLYTLMTPYTESQVFAIDYVQSADVLYLVHPDHAPRSLSRTGHDAWTLAALTFAPTISAPANPGVTATNGTGHDPMDVETYSYRVTATDIETGEESLPTATVSVDNDLTKEGAKNTLTWDAVTGASYTVYKLDNGVYGFAGDTDATSFDDDNIDPDRGITPPSARNPFDGAGNDPAAIALFEQRLCTAGFDSAPTKLEMSTSANFLNFSVSSPRQANDAVTLSLVAQQLNSIRYLVPLGDLIAMTSSTEWRIKGAQDPGFITGDGRNEVRPQSYWGCAAVKPLVVGNTALFVQDKGGKVRDLIYEFASDGFNSADLSVFSEHLFEDYAIVDWCWAKSPHSLVWAVRSDGKLLSMTYLREHQIWAWALHETDGVVESVCAVSEGDMDAVYLVVRRTVGGRQVRFVERLADRRFAAIADAWFLDCAVKYDGAPTATLTNLHNLEGRTVVALADGHVTPPKVVTDGTVTFVRPYSKILVGLPYAAEIATLPMDLGANSHGRTKAVSRVTVRARETRGVFAGPDTGNDADLTEFKQRATEGWGEAIQPVTADFEIEIATHWALNGELRIRQADPLPMSISAIMPEVAVGG